MRKTTIAAICALTFFTISTFARAGGESSGGGGNGSVAEFRRLGREIFAQLQNQGTISYGGSIVEVEKIAGALDKADVNVSTIPLVLNGKPVDAINYPDELKIVFYENSWQALSLESKRQLVVHELLGLTKFSPADLDYKVSEFLLERFHRTTIETFVLYMAKANVLLSEKATVLRHRTKIKSYKPNKDDPEMTGLIYTVYVQTFENSSPDSVRIYKVYVDETGAVVKAQLVGAKGPVGP